jgi:hypothetical protein
MSSDKKPKFRSGLEEKVWQDAIDNGRQLDYEPASPVIHYVIPTRYIPDFLLPNGVFIEVKGWLRPRDRAKMLRVKREHPGLDIRFVFQRANSRISKSKNSLMYWEWAEKHGYLWAEGLIPQEWYE